MKKKRFSNQNKTTYVTVLVLQSIRNDRNGNEVDGARPVTQVQEADKLLVVAKSKGQSRAALTQGSLLTQKDAAFSEKAGLARANPTPRLPKEQELPVFVTAPRAFRYSTTFLFSSRIPGNRFPRIVQTSTAFTNVSRAKVSMSEPDTNKKDNILTCSEQTSVFNARKAR